jgi:hypothetical protein
LHTTVSMIQARGIRVNRRTETVRGFQGHPTRVARYWLCDSEKEKAAVLLGWTSWRAQG